MTTTPAGWSRALRLALLAAAWGRVFPAPAPAQTVDETRYAWEFPVVRAIDSVPTAGLVADLRHEVQRILEAGPLAPLYLSHADQESVGYTVYQEPGRIVATLAWAYPHLDAAAQTAVRGYVNATFADARFSPWGVTAAGRNGNSNFPLPRAAGAAREDHPKERWWNERSDFGYNRPFVFTLYGVWLYGWRSGDWTAIDAHWTAIRQRYLDHATTAQARLYGTLGAHIAVARLAERQGDRTTRDTALTNLRACLQAGLDFAAIEQIARGAAGLEWQSPYGSYPSMYDDRMTGSTYRGWVFLNLTPEIGRFLREENSTLRSAVLARHDAGKAAFPLWWIPKISYFNRSWTGDEGSGLVPEVIGMIAPVERWVAQAEAATLARQMRGSPNGIGDCHWLEALVQAIEAHGTTIWHDVRTALTGAPIIRTPPAAATVVEGREVTLRVEASGEGMLHYQWRRNGVAIPGAASPSLTLGAAQASQAGSYDVLVNNAAGSTTSASVVLTVAPAGQLTSRLLNLSARGFAGLGEAALIPGFAVAGSGTQRVLLRAVGPALAPFGVSGLLVDPRLSLKRMQPPGPALDLAANDNWGAPLGGFPDAGAIAAAAGATGAFDLPAASTDAALLADLASGLHTVVCTGSAGETGNALVEVYEVPREGMESAALVNLSTRAYVGTGDSALIAGFYIDAGGGGRRVLIRAVGPSLAAYGVSGTLADPRLDVFRQESLIAGNDDWAEEGAGAWLAETFASVEAFPLAEGSADAAIVLTLGPGGYTVIVSGEGAGAAAMGVALVEIYRLP